MSNSRRVAALTLATATIFAAGLFAQDKTQEEAQKKETQNILKDADKLLAAPAAANDLGLAWLRQDFLKAQGNKEYVPFTVSVDPSKVASGAVVLYWRVTQTAGAPAPKEKGKGKYPYEDVSFATVTPGQGPAFISRSFTVPAGDYDVTVIAREAKSEQKNAPPPKSSVLKQAVSVPDFWNGELSTSSVILAQKIEPLSAPLTPQQQAEHPYVLGTMEIVPVNETKFPKKTELQTFLLIYNPKTDATSNKPDVSVEYNFYAKSGGTEKFFNKTNPQNLNAQTLPPQFDLAAGHQLQSGQAVPLTSFPEGDYRLEIKITDKIANKSLTRDINFSVMGS